VWLAERHDLGDFFGQQRRAEWFDDIVINFALGSFNDVSLVGLGGNHEKGETLESTIGSHSLQ